MADPSCWTQIKVGTKKCVAAIRSKIGLLDKGKSLGATGFKSIQKKSLHFPSARYRESLMEIAMLCEENSVNNFVDNLDDLTVLFSSMSPAVVEFFENGFNESRFTRKIKNLDWSLGTTLKVIGQRDSPITEKKAGALVMKGKNPDSDNV